MIHRPHCEKADGKISCREMRLRGRQRQIKDSSPLTQNAISIDTLLRCC